MKPVRFLLAFILAGAFGAEADVYRCKTPTGKIVITDTGCSGNAGIDTVRNSEAPTLQQQREAAEVHARRRQQLDAIAAGNAAWRNQPERSGQLPVAPQATQAGSSAGDEEAIRQCIRDVERQGPPEGQKAQLITACRTAGTSQRKSGIREDQVRNCVRNVERTGAAGSAKARQIALCHGGDVPPETHEGTGGPLFRSDGKTCRKVANMLQCN